MPAQTAADPMAETLAQAGSRRIGCVVGASANGSGDGVVNPTVTNLFR